MPTAQASAESLRRSRRPTQSADRESCASAYVWASRLGDTRGSKSCWGSVAKLGKRVGYRLICCGHAEIAATVIQMASLRTGGDHRCGGMVCDVLFPIGMSKNFSWSEGATTMCTKTVVSARHLENDEHQVLR